MILTTKPIKGSDARLIFPIGTHNDALWYHCVGKRVITKEQFYAKGLDKVLANHTTFTIEDE